MNTRHCNSFAENRLNNELNKSYLTMVTGAENQPNSTCHCCNNEFSSHVTDMQNVHHT